MCGPAFEFRTRISALSALEALDNLPESVVVNALDAAVHFNARLARQGQSLLEQNWDESLQRLCEGYLKFRFSAKAVKKWERFLKNECLRRGIMVWQIARAYRSSFAKLASSLRSPFSRVIWAKSGLFLTLSMT